MIPAPILRASARRLAAALLLGAGGASAAPQGWSAYAWSGSSYVALTELARAYGLRASQPAESRVQLSSPYSAMIFERDSRRMTLLGTQIWLEFPMVRAGAEWAVNLLDARGIIDPILRPYLYLRGRDCSVVVLDPGHGGMDGGTLGRGGLVEKNLTLDLARRVRARLAGTGLSVRLTREGDRFVELETRTRLAARWGAHLFVSLHANSSPDRTAAGIETFILAKPGGASTHASDGRSAKPALRWRYPAVAANAHDAPSALLGFRLQRQLVRRAPAEDRGLKHARFTVLKTAPCPAALVEVGFLSKRSEEDRLARDDYRDRLAEAVARALLEYRADLQRAQHMRP